MTTPRIGEPIRLLRSSPARGGQPRVDRAAGVIRGYSVMTIGEALGHDLYLDMEFARQAVDSINSARMGVKTRFTHPSLSADGLGKFLGRTSNARLAGQQVLGDLQISELADQSPDGKLGSYVMDLAESDPQAFGASIVFEHDQGAEKQFIGANSDKNGEFRSPDKANTRNLPHARLSAVSAADIVDSPAANPGGMFSDPSGLGRELDRLAEYALGLSNTPPGLVALDVNADRVKGFAARFLESRGLRIVAALPLDSIRVATVETAQIAANGAAGPPATNSFGAAVHDVMRRMGVPEIQARAIVARDQPELHAAYCAAMRLQNVPR